MCIASYQTYFAFSCSLYKSVILLACLTCMCVHTQLLPLSLMLVILRGGEFRKRSQVMRDAADECEPILPPGGSHPHTYSHVSAQQSTHHSHTSGASSRQPSAPPSPYHHPYPPGVVIEEDA